MSLLGRLPGLHVRAPGGVWCEVLADVLFDPHVSDTLLTFSHWFMVIGCGHSRFPQCLFKEGKMVLVRSLRLLLFT